MLPFQFLPQNRCRFTVWAPEKESMVLQIIQPFHLEFSMHKDEWGYFSVEVECHDKGIRYFYKPNGIKAYPDPASHYQPEGVHGPSQTVGHDGYKWNDNGWKGLPLEELVIYELHVGTFTPEGTFEAIIPRLDRLKETGITALELMPVAQFPGNRNWGYDGVYPYAVQNSYGGPEGLKKLVDACHQKGIAVFLDVVYNHLGPEGNYFSQYGPYFTHKYHTPWGDAINFDGEWSDGVREFFSNNALHWMENYRIDGLRCDAIHAVFDNGAVHFWELTSQKVKDLEQRTGKRFLLMAESDLNSPRVVRSPEQGGYGFDAQWLDDFHHALYVLVNPKDKDRYYDFGSMEQLAKAYTGGFVHSGEWVKFRKRKHGASSAGVPGNKFIAFNLNHDQAGNRAGGERLCMLVDMERVKLAAAALLLSPYIPLLFMGEEYADDTPFFYFVSHSDKELIKAVQEGRKEEFKDFGFDVEIPDPQDEHTFERSKIKWEKRDSGEYKIIRLWHEELLRMRKTVSPLKDFNKENVQVDVINQSAFALFRKSAETGEKLLCLFNLSEEEISYPILSEFNGNRKILDSKESRWLKAEQQEENIYPQSVNAGQNISLPPLSVVVYSEK
jgi:maltooligosyltrehalose trehalohydrolase